MLSDQVIEFWTSPRLPRVACEDKYFFLLWVGVPHFHMNRPLVNYVLDQLFIPTKAQNNKNVGLDIK